MAVTAYVGLGSNLGDRRDYLDRAVEALRARPGIEVTRVSSYYETDPVGGPPGQGPYLNACAELHTELGADDLLLTLLETETALGRVRSERHGPRTIDLDLLLHGGVVVDKPWLTVPHPLMHERFFVLEPLAEIAPDAVHPVFDCPIRDLLWKLRLNPPEERGPGPGSRGPAEASEMSSAGRGEREPGGAVPRAGRELAGLRAMVTGSTSGIGRAIALELAAAGADVLVHGRRSLEAAQSVARRVEEQGVRGGSFLADLSRPEHCRELVQGAWGRWGGLDVWINNAGADTLTGEAATWPFERKLQALLAVDVTATAVLSREVGRRMKEAGAGVLLNMGWDQADWGMEGDSGQLFGLSKAAVMAFTKSLALSLAPEVRVNCLAPGWVRTAWGEGASDRWQDRVRRETPLGRWGRAEDVAAAARWLVSPAASFITGQVVRINGGTVR